MILISNQKMKKLVILQTVSPDYRKSLFFFLKKRLKNSFELYSGDSYFEKSIKSDTSIFFRKHLKNKFFFKRKLLLQKGIWSIASGDNVLIIELNPRIISNWIILLYRRASNKKTILWGHAWSRSGNSKKGDKIRNLMRKLGNEIIVYTKTQQNELQNKMTAKKILVAPNALFYNKEMIISEEIDLIKNLIYVGRLNKNKKPLLLVEAFHQVLNRLPGDVKLLIVGDGEEREGIENYIKRNNLSNRIISYGHIGDYDRLKELYDITLVSISPGYVGLSITQSFGFGVPMIVSRNELHSPEIEAVDEGKNALFFETNDVNSLAEQILNIYQQKESWVNRRRSISQKCKMEYSIEIMGDAFIRLLHEK